uniref:Uncharacterized protein n=1 Tax=uncultured marine group II/III euryarchaeote AD1000_55_G04 TaxID=1457786 RepID=A0A075FTS7_9EURY|nr:hypothetical protein [uncultured marine group II/III euryarchaeote AD1000_55_G04]
MNSISSDSDYNLLVPIDILNKIPDDIKNDPDRLRGHLVRALKIGLLAIEGGEFTLSTERIENAIDSTIVKYQDFDTEFEKSLSLLIDQKLTGDESQLANRLSASFGERGDLKKRLDVIFDDISNPDKASSVPNRVTAAMDTKFEGVEKEITSALDMASEDSPLRHFLNEQRTNFNNLQSDLKAEMDKIKSALNVDELLQSKDDEISDLKDKSSHKGIHFENDSVDALQDIAEILGDHIVHTGGEGEGASRSKVGDIVIIIQHQGVPELRIAVEAKAGGIGRKEMIRQVRSGVENRNATRGIGLMERKHMGVTQHVIGQEGENYIVGVDWANGDFLSLEVTYRMLRSVMIADALRMEGSESIDIDAIKKRLEQAKTDLGMIQSMKTQTKTAISTLEGVRSNMDVMQNKVKEQLSKAEDLL